MEVAPTYVLADELLTEESIGKQAQESLEFSKLSIAQLKECLVDLLPRMTGQPDEFRMVEGLVNAMEQKYQPPQTLPFLNLMMEGDWQLLFSTNLPGTPNPSKFRLRELLQRVECHDLEGRIVNQVTWDLAEAADANFASTGMFQVVCDYHIQKGSRMNMSVRDHVLRPQTGTPIPTDVPALVGLLHRAMPKELFDPNEHSIDTTYLDGDLRIIRYTGPRFEGVRDILVRRGKLEIRPV